jgi:GNAT superfamily N-acetyltransferase
MTTESIFEIQNQRFEMGSLEFNDIDPLVEVARQWVKNRFTGQVEQEELEGVRERMMSSLESIEYKYFVVRDENHRAIGCCALREPEPKMEIYKSSPASKSLELVNVFLDKSHHGKGLGYRLMNYMFDQARELGKEEVIWNSGPRYRDSAWSFYKRIAGEPFAIAPAFYGYAPDESPNDAPVWRKEL